MLKVDYFTNRVFNSRTYILSKEGSDEVWLVDCGDIDRLLECFLEQVDSLILLEEQRCQKVAKPSLH